MPNLKKECWIMRKKKTKYQIMMADIKKRVNKVIKHPDRFSPAEPIRKSKPEGVITPQTVKKHEHLGELHFIRNYFTHKNWIPQPALFSLNGKGYKPDFYDVERNTFIEVSGTRQAYHANKDKYDLFRKLYPKINFEIRKPNGELLKEDEPIHPQLKAATL